MMHLRSLHLFLLFLTNDARRKIRIDSSHRDAQQQDRTLNNGFEMSAEAREAIIPGGFGTGVFRTTGSQAGALHAGSKQNGRRARRVEPLSVAPWFRSGLLRANVALQAAGSSKAGQLPLKVDDQRMLNVVAPTTLPLPVGRREFIARGARAAATAVGSTAGVAAAGATLTDDLRNGEEALRQARDSESAAAALTRLLQTVQAQGGLATDKMREDLVGTMRTTRSALQASSAWDGISEEAYNRLMRSVDAWRVTELQPIAQNAILGFAPVYIGLLAVQQLVPETFPLAYGVGAALLLGPLLFQIIAG